MKFLLQIVEFFRTPLSPTPEEKRLAQQKRRATAGVILALGAGIGVVGSTRGGPEFAGGTTTTAAPTTTTTTSTTLPPTTTTTQPGGSNTWEWTTCTQRDVNGGVPVNTWPGSACTGYVAGTQLTNQGANDGSFFRITDDNSTWSDYNFTANVCVAADNVTIENSYISGILAIANPVGAGGCGVATGAQNVVAVDVEINTGQFALAIEMYGYTAGFTCTRCNVHHNGAAIAGHDYTVTDSYFHDLWGAYDCQLYPPDCITHLDGFQVYQGNVTVQRTVVDAIEDPAHDQGGVSCAGCLYTHGDCGGFCWGPMDNVLIQQVRFRAPDAGTCVWAGGSTDQNPTNIRFIDNVWVSADCASPVGGWEQNAGNVWSSNHYDDGTLFPEPSP